MTLHRNHRQISWECDTCGEVLDTETHDFDEAREKLLDEGWSAVHLDQWEHYCPGCG